MPLNETGPFDPRPRTQADYTRENWRLLTEEVVPRLDRTNGRLRALEKFMWGLLGGMVVIGAIVVPEFLHAVLL